MHNAEAMLVLIFGASGSGKSTLMENLQSTGSALTIHRKGTDRPPKIYDSDELQCLPKITSDRYEYIYRNYGYAYGIQKSQIDASLNADTDHFVICNDIDTIRMLRKDYGNRVRALFLLFDAPRDHFERVQKRRGMSEDQLDLRLAKIGVLSELFLDNSDLFDGVILNRLGTPSGDMVQQVQLILGRNYQQTSSSVRVTQRTNMEQRQGIIDKQVLHDLVDVIQVIQENLKSQDLDRNIVQRGYVFILMAMAANDPQLEDVHMAIKRAATVRGMRAERVDDIAFTEQITDKVLGNIRCAEYIVADLTHDRPNVYYELGYAHAHKKRTVLTARKGTQPHFDVQGFPIIFYDSATKLERELARFFESFQGPE